VTVSKRIKQIFSYNPVTGVEAYRVHDRDPRRDTIVRINGMFGELLQLSELDVAGARYFTTPLRAIEAFVDKAEAALADTSRKAHHKDWRRALADARRDLSSQILATRDV
jgi:hypothetical protein